MAAPFRRYVAIGDSLSEGIGDEVGPDGRHRGWADRLATLLDDGALAYANLALRSAVTGQVREQARAAALLRPDLVTVSTGANDLLRARFDLERFHAGVEDIATRLTDVGAQVLFVPMPPLYAISRGLGWARPRVVAANLALEACARRPGVDVVPLPPVGVLTDPRMFCDDRLHLGPEGHERLARMAVARLAGTVDLGAVAPFDGEPPVRSGAQWFREHLWPWVERHALGRGVPEPVGPKRPALGPVPRPQSR